MHEHVSFGLVGTGGFGREVAPMAIEFLTSMDSYSPKQNKLDVYFVDKAGVRTAAVNGITAVDDEQFLALDCDRKIFNIAISDSKRRELVANRFLAGGAEPITLIAGSAVNRANQPIGEGSIICDLTTILPDARIGRFCHLNIYSYIAHDCVIGDFVTFAPRVNCNGNVHVEDHAYIGTAAVLRPGSPDKPLRIGKGAVVGMGAVVTRDVEPYTTVIGNPATSLTTIVWVAA